VTLRVIDDSARVRLELESRPQSVTLVRATLAAFAEAVGLEGEFLDDLKTAVSEACNNVVLHAYDGEVGPLTVAIASTPGSLEVLVQDQGEGIRQVAAAEDRMGVGLAVISALADRAEFQSRHAGGTEVRMSFDRGGMRTIYSAPRQDPEPVPVTLTGDAVVWLTPSSLLAPVLGRLCRAVAATSHFSLERFADLYAVNDAIGAYAERAAGGGPIGFSIGATTRRLELTGGPFLPQDGDGAPATDASDRRNRLASLVDELVVEQLDEFDLVHILFVDHSRELRELT
jgi:anti-sigma regulatory factor (Ser/Thr protein kinase)